MRRTAFGFLLVFLFLTGSGVADEVNTLTDRTNRVRLMMSDANLFRTRKGLPPLTLDSSLCRAADVHACEMANYHYFGHRGLRPTFASTPGSRAFVQGYSWVRIAENICSGYNTVSEAFNSFVYSEPHYRNLINPELVDIGIGVARGDSQRIYWVMLPGRQSSFGQPGHRSGGLLPNASFAAVTRSLRRGDRRHDQ
jgi:uncharacterized protein YkwD